jgi:hypothetical protein
MGMKSRFLADLQATIIAETPVFSLGGMASEGMFRANPDELAS